MIVTLKACRMGNLRNLPVQLRWAIAKQHE